MNLEFQDAPGIHNPDWCEAQRQIVAAGKARGWISFVPRSGHVPASESPPAVNVAQKDRLNQPTKSQPRTTFQESESPVWLALGLRFWLFLPVLIKMRLPVVSIFAAKSRKVDENAEKHWFS